MDKTYERLFTPGKINNLTLKNRIVYPPMAYHINHPTGEMSDQMIELFARRARGGVAMMITSPMFTQKTKHRQTLQTLSLHQKVIIPPPNQIDMRKQLSRVVWAPAEPIPALNPMMYYLIEAVQKYGCRICASLSPNPIGWTLLNYDPDDPEGQGLTLYNKMPTNDVEETIEEYAAVAGELKKIGFDAIEMDLSYFPDYFAHASFNKRKDKYGGKDLTDRLLYHQELVHATRAAVGTDFPLSCFIDIDHFGAVGWRTLEESKQVVKKLEEFGIDAVRARGGGTVKAHYDIAPMYLPKGVCIPLAAGIKEVVKIPVIAATSLDDPDLAEKVLADGKADFIAIGRGLIADPDLPNKVRSGMANRVRKCVHDNVGCLGNLVMIPRRPSRCTVNPCFGYEYQLPDRIEAANHKKRVVIVGGGQGGMSAALTAAQRGHSVVMYEKTGKLGGGGHFRLACIPPHKDELLKITDFYTREYADYTNLQLRLNTEADVKSILDEKPDVVIIATGGSAKIPDLPGVDNPRVLLYDDVLLGKKEIGEKIIILGGGEIGCEVALYLLAQGRQVVILEKLHRLADSAELTTRNCLMEELPQAGAEMITNAHIVSVTGDRVNYRRDGKEMGLAGDTFVLAMCAKSNDELYFELNKSVASLHVIGDAKEPRQIINAVSEGFWTAYAL